MRRVDLQPGAILKWQDSSLRYMLLAPIRFKKPEPRGTHWLIIEVDAESEATFLNNQAVVYDFHNVLSKWKVVGRPSVA